MPASSPAPLARSALGTGVVTRALVCALVAGSGGLALPSPARAQSAKPSRAWMKDMQALIDKATQAYGAARYEEALISLRRAERKAEDAGQLDFLASIRFNIARCLEQLGRKKEALEAYRAYDKLPDLPHRKQKAFASIEKLQADVLGVLAVTCQQEGSSVLVLEVSDAAQSCPFRSRGLDPGRYEVEVDAPGHLKSVRAVQIRAGATTAVDFDLSPQPAAPPTAARAPGVVVADAPGPPRELSPWPWVTMGTGAALVGLGAVFNVIGSEQINDANELPPTQERADLVSGSETNEALTYALYGVGAAAAAGGLVWLIIDMTSGGEAEALGFHANAQGIEVRF